MPVTAGEAAFQLAVVHPLSREPIVSSVRSGANFLWAAHLVGRRRVVRRAWLPLVTRRVSAAGEPGAVGRRTQRSPPPVVKPGRFRLGLRSPAWGTRLCGWFKSPSGRVIITGLAGRRGTVVGERSH